MVKKKRYVLEVVHGWVGGGNGPDKYIEKYWIRDTQTLKVNTFLEVTEFELIAKFKEEQKDKAIECLNALNKELKLYVWEGVLSCWTPGMAFAVAKSKEEAINLIIEDIEWDENGHRGELINQKPDVHELTEKIAYHVHGGD